MKKTKFFKQLESMDCGPTCLRMIARYYGRNISLESLREACNITRLGTSIYSIVKGAEKIGLHAVPFESNIEHLQKNVPYPCILFWRNSHFVVLESVYHRRRTIFQSKPARTYRILDPAYGVVKLDENGLMKMWSGTKPTGVLIAFEPTERFYDIEFENGQRENSAKPFIEKLRHIIAKQWWGFSQVVLYMLITSSIFVSLPLLTKKLVDVGVKQNDIEFIKLILLGQCVLFLVSASVDLIKAKTLLHIGTKIGLSLSASFLSKMMQLPMFFFDAKLTGDLLQRINDNSRIESFIKTNFLDFLMSVSITISLASLLYTYDQKLFSIFIIGTSISFIWTFRFLKIRAFLDYQRFDATSENTENMIETIVAMPEIKLNDAVLSKLSKWKNIQLKLFDVNSRILSYQQYQSIGNNFVNQIRNTIIIFVAAEAVINNEISLGTLLSTSFILGQMSGPLNSMASFFQTLQDARISFSRLLEVQSKQEEDEYLTENEIEEPGKYIITNKKITQVLSDFNGIEIRSVKFSYTGSDDDLLFNDLNLFIPARKVTAIVGASGSGKTTLLKLLLKFYPPNSGHIYLDNYDLTNIKADVWRRNCGVVMQEGHIFFDTIYNNIVMSDPDPVPENVEKAARMACIDEFILSLPMKYSTKIGANGLGISIGQKQRILIARAIYKNPNIIFLDEATSSLDATNERNILDNLNNFFIDRTVLIVAHRLSTVRNADNIIVLNNGKIVELGHHDHLVSSKGYYYNLIQNQLELGT